MIRGGGAESLGFELFAGLDVDVPAAETTGQTHILTLLADGEGLLVFVDYDNYRMVVDVGVNIVQVNRGRFQAVHHQRFERVAPADDVDPFAP